MCSFIFVLSGNARGYICKLSKLQTIQRKWYFSELTNPRDLFINMFVYATEDFEHNAISIIWTMWDIYDRYWFTIKYRCNIIRDGSCLKVTGCMLQLKYLISMTKVSYMFKCVTFVRDIHHLPVDFPNKGPMGTKGQCFHVMTPSCRRPVFKGRRPSSS